MTTSIDPVCGMTVENDDSLRETYQGRDYYFCSEECMHKFQDRPQEFVPAA